jgi:hypothetical protein
MDSEMLEKLLMDKALGAVSPEVGALLGAYLEGDARARKEAVAIDGVVGLARKAVGGGAELKAAPAFRADEVRTVRRRRVIGRIGAIAAGMAACLTVGFVLGAFRTRGGAQVGTVPVVAQVAGEVRMEDSKTDFWSVERLRAMAKRNEREDHGDDVRAAYLAQWFKQVGG